VFSSGIRARGLLVLLVLAAAGAHAEPRVLRIAMTNAQKDSGLFDALLPEFSNRSGYAIRVTAREMGAVLGLARRGEVDVVLADSPEAEEALVKDGVAVLRTPFMESRFVLVGPKADPAGLARIATPEAAMTQIFRLRSPFVSRADESTANLRERALFQSAGVDPESRWDRLVRTGTSMRDSLRVASERGAYILSDLGTFLVLSKELDLVVLSKPAKSLRTVHSILQLDSTRFERPIEIEGAKALATDLVSPGVQARIRSFGIDRFGEASFEPMRTDTRQGSPE
jgi:tungstate transport system substrate-binding protein